MNRKPTAKLGSMVDWTILIVDDTPDNVIVAKTALEFHGATVYTAHNGEEGLEVLKTHRPTVILLDIRMPKMNGWAMFKSVREDKAIAHIPIIAITAYAMDNDKEKILVAGFDGYIAKPFDIFTIAESIQTFVANAVKKNQKSGETIE